MSGAAAAAARAAIANAIKASGAIVEMKPDDFRKILNQADNPLVVAAHGGFLYRKVRYLFSHRGLIFVTLTDASDHMVSGRQVVWAEKIWVPNV